MNGPEFVNWLKRENLFGKVSRNYPYFMNILKDMLGLKSQTLMIITDKGKPKSRCAPIMAGCYLLAAKRLNLNYKLVVQKAHSRRENADLQTVLALDNFPENNAIATCISGKIGSLKKLGKSFRTYVNKRNIRFVSTPSLAELPTDKFRYLVNAINVDYKAMQKKGKKLKLLMDKAKEIYVSTPGGSNFWFNVKGMSAISNDGKYKHGGGNIPCGEVYIPPRGKGVWGTIVIDGSSRNNNGTVLTKNPIKLRIEKGEVVDISGGKEADMLSRTLDEICKQAKYPWGVRRVGELGIGINPNAKVVGPNIINEKALGTCHIALGSNAWFGGSIYAISHLDQVMMNPEIFIDDKKIVIR